MMEYLPFRVTHLPYSQYIIAVKQPVYVMYYHKLLDTEDAQIHFQRREASILRRQHLFHACGADHGKVSNHPVHCTISCADLKQ